MFRSYVCVVLILGLMCGCAKRREGPTSSLVEDDKKYLVAVLLDMSGSFSHLMAEDGKAHQFLLQILDRYFRDSMGNDDKIVISMISGSDRALLWQGTPVQLRRDFSSAASFRAFLNTKANMGGSRVHDALAQTANYVATDPSIKKGKAKSAIFVLSDMLDNAPDSQESEKKAVEALARYSQAGGVVGMYYVDQHMMTGWREHLERTGMRDYCIEADIVGQPNLPTFE